VSVGGEERSFLFLLPSLFFSGGGKRGEEVSFHLAVSEERGRGGFRVSYNLLPMRGKKERREKKEATPPFSIAGSMEKKREDTSSHSISTEEGEKKEKEGRENGVPSITGRIGHERRFFYRKRRKRGSESLRGVEREEGKGRKRGSGLIIASARRKREERELLTKENFPLQEEEEKRDVDPLQNSVSKRRVRIVYIYSCRISRREEKRGKRHHHV